LLKRKAAGLSQQQLADEAGIDKQTVSRIERGEVTAPDSQTLAAMAGPLGVEPTSLLELLLVDRNQQHQEVTGKVTPSSVSQSPIQAGQRSPTGSTLSLPPGEAGANGEGGGSVRDDFGGLRLRWDRVPEDRRLEAVRLLEQTLDSFLEGAAKPARRAALPAVAHKRGA
jgi:transcriptional regulator with XRE-family HTH domain